MENNILVECRNVSKTYGNGTIKSVNSVNLTIHRGETYGLVGESGSGKTTLGNLILKLLKPDTGTILYSNRDISRLSGKEEKAFRKKAQIIFQDPYSSLDPMMKVSDIIGEGLDIHSMYRTREERDRLINEMRTMTGLSPELMNRKPGELSGGQRQRIAIASAMILKPEFVVLDEPVSSLDVLIQAQILNLLKDMQKAFGLSYLFISHNLDVVAYMADRIGVMLEGRIIEEGSAEKILNNPEHEYTKKLFSSISRIKA